MTLITFTSGSYVWQPSRNPAEPTETPHTEQATAVTAGGVVYGYDPVATWRTIPLSWQWLPDADLAALLEFFGGINWLAGQFTVTDPAGGSYLAELDSPTINTVEQYPGGKAVNFTIRRLP